MSIITYKCPNCGGPLKFGVDTQNWKCEFCLSTFNNDEVEAMEKKNTEAEPADADAAQEQGAADDEFASKARVYSCTSCGAEIVTDETTAATFCYYCHNPAIIPGQLSGNYKPSKVIPFKIGRDKATEAFIKWCKRKPLLSRKFISDANLKLLSGIYIPFWLFDCDAEGEMSADGRKVRSWTSGDERYTETRYYNVRRAGEATFEGMPADGSQKIEDGLMEAIEPFDYSQMEDFSMAYLSGYFAQKYDMDQNQVFGRIKERIYDYTSHLLRETITGYTTVTVKGCNVNVYDAAADYVLLPAWMFTYSYKGKTYMFAMNGQTGKIGGRLPLSIARMAVWFFGVSAVSFAILVIGGMLL